MGEGVKNFFKALTSLAIGYGMAYVWSIFRPTDGYEISLVVGFLGALLSFIFLYFVGKGS